MSVIKYNCCKRQSIASMDYKKSGPRGWNFPVPVINHMCMHCGQHWYGEEGAVKEYTKAQWDAWIATAFNVT